MSPAKLAWWTILANIAALLLILSIIALPVHAAGISRLGTRVPNSPEVPAVPPEAAIPVLTAEVATPPLVLFKASHYWPNAGGPNCGSRLVNGECMSRMGGSGLRWQEYIQVAVACPMSYPTWTVIHIVEPASIAGVYVCLDHGGAIVETPEGDWLDFLWPLETWPLKHGQIIYGWIEVTP